MGLFKVTSSYCTIGTFVFISIRKSLQALQPSLFQATVSVSVCWSISADRGSQFLKVTWFCFGWMSHLYQMTPSNSPCELFVRAATPSGLMQRSLLVLRLFHMLQHLRYFPSPGSNLKWSNVSGDYKPVNKNMKWWSSFDWYTLCHKGIKWLIQHFEPDSGRRLMTTQQQEILIVFWKPKCLLTLFRGFSVRTLTVKPYG